MKAGGELRLQRFVDRAVFRHARESGKRVCLDADGIVRLPARRRASMPMVKVGLVHYL